MATRKRSNGEGSIYKNEKRDRWEALLVVGHHPNGRLQRRTFTGKTRKLVAAKLSDAKAALDQGLNIPDNRSTIEEFASWWLTDIVPGEGLAPRPNSGTTTSSPATSHPTSAIRN